MQLDRVIRPHCALEVPLVIVLLHFCVNMMAHDGSKRCRTIFYSHVFGFFLIYPQSPQILKTGAANCIADAIVRIICKCYILWSPLISRQCIKRSISKFLSTLFRGVSVPVDICILNNGFTTTLKHGLLER